MSRLLNAFDAITGNAQVISLHELQERIDRAVLAERERCARVADSYARERSTDGPSWPLITAAEIASAIRKEPTCEL